jgi:hypothetical protein
MRRGKRITVTVPRWNSLAFLTLVSLLPMTTLLYGAVHPITIALTYSILGSVAVIVMTARLFGAEQSVTVDGISLSLLLASLYCVIQIIPFGNVTIPEAGVSVGRTISVDVFWTSVSAVQFLLLGVFLILMNSMLAVGSRLKVFATAFVVFSIGYAFFGIIQSIISPGKIYGVYEVVGASPFGSFVNRHNFAAVIEMAIAIPLAFIISGNLERDRKFLFMVITGALGVALLMSGSRGGLVALGLMVVLLLLMVQKGKSRGKLALPKQLGLIAVLVLGLIGGMVFIGGDNTLTRVADTATQGDFSTNRLEIWGVTMEVIRENLPLGAGFGAFRTAYAPFDPTSGLQRVEQAHNDYLQVVADGGIPGIAIGLLFLFLLVRTANGAVRIQDREMRSLALGVTGGIFAVLVHSLFDFVLHTTAVALLFLSQIAILIVISRRAAEHMESTRNDTSTGVNVAEFEPRQD